MNDLTLTVCNTTIRQDAEGRYCLNDLHKAAGGNDRDKPVHFFKLDSTEALAIELLKGKDSYLYAPIKTTAGRHGGTFVVKELVYAYAMWISPVFHLRVIRAYDALMTEKQQPQNQFHIPQTYAEALRLSADLHDQNAKMTS